MGELKEKDIDAFNKQKQIQKTNELLSIENENYKSQIEDRDR